MHALFERHPILALVLAVLATLVWWIAMALAGRIHASRRVQERFDEVHARVHREETFI